jgi:hypothetical protein
MKKRGQGINAWPVERDFTSRIEGERGSERVKKRGSERVTRREVAKE